MSEADRRARVDALFDRALDLDEAAREGFLRSACDDASMQAEILELLRLVAQPSSILDPDRIVEGPLWRAIAAGSEGRAEPREGERVGPWRLVRQLGRGGMGTVFLAERVEGRFQQRAALKLLHLGADSEEMLRRFERERQILASLGHAHIARLLDGGCTADGRPFLAMEYVEGRRIDRYCDEERLDVDARLALFVCVARALEHAHRNLVIHRDVKPSNIVVTGEGEVKLLDFGIAKLLSPSAADGDALTRTVVRVLTPEYASPEQVRGEPVTTASDVYQLGLLLYELLTGTRAQHVEGTSPQALERAVCEGSPGPPGTRRAPALSPFRGDLDTIVLHALRKEPARRYASVGDLIEDIERYRRGMPIRARADTWVYRSGRFAARHRAALLGTGIAAAVVAVALASWTGQRSRAGREAERAEQMERLLGELFLLPNPRRDATLPNARDYIARAVTLVQRDLGAHPVTRGRLLTDIGRNYAVLGAYPAAEEVLGQALSIREQHFGAESTEVADTLVWLGMAQHYRGRYPQAEASLRRGLRIQQQLLGDDHFKPTSTAIELGDLLHSRGQLAEAEALLRPVLARLQGRDGVAGLLFACRSYLANVLRDRGALGAAESLYVQAAADADVAPSVDHARLLVLKGDLAGAERVLVPELLRLRRVYAGDHPLTAQCLRHLGHLRMEQGRLEEAEASLAEAQAIFAQWLEAEHPMFARTRAAQAEVARRRGRTQDASRLAHEALDRFERLGLSEHPAALDACHTLGRVLLDLGRPAAEPLGRCQTVTRLEAARRQLLDYTRGRSVPVPFRAPAPNR